jgi:hypothetical protein
LVNARCTKNHPEELTSMPGMNKDLITKYLEPSTATSKGHMVRVLNTICSTRSTHLAILEARQEVDDMAPTEQMCSTIQNELFCFAILRDETGNTSYSDLTGRSPIELHTGMNYMCVCCVYKLTGILLSWFKKKE